MVCSTLLTASLLEMQETLAFSDFQSGWRDLNPRPLDPQSSALPNCATARRRRMVTRREYTTGGVFPKRSRDGVDFSPNTPSQEEPAGFRSGSASTARIERISSLDAAFPAIAEARRHWPDSP